MGAAVVTREWSGPALQLAWLNEQLQRLAPRSESQLWMHAYWEPGDVWMPLERIVIAQMTPRKLLVAQDRFFRAMGEGSDASQFSELEGPNPRWGGHYDAQLGRYVHAEWRLPPTITERQWLLWRSEGALAEPAWIVQGDEGGTPRRPSRWEAELARVERRPHSPVLPGALDFAPADQRVIAGVMRHFDAQERSTRVREEWLHVPEPERSEEEQILHDRFDAWFSSRNEARASGQVTDAAYDPTTGRFAVADYTKA